MVQRHGPAKLGHVAPLVRRGAAVALRLLDEPRLVEQLIALQHLLLVPAGADAEADLEPFRSPQSPRGVIRRWWPLGPFLQPRLDFVRQDLGLAVPPVLPRQIRVPGRPMRAHHLLARAARKREIADRERMRPAWLRVPPTVAEGVELLHIAELDPGLALHPFAQADLQRPVRARRERAKGQRVPCAGAGRPGTGDEDM